MKYKAVIETDDYKGFEFYEDGIGKYMVGKDANVTVKGHGWIPLYFTECEQEPILDKIRAEIKANRDDWIQGDIKWNIYDCCLQIIDKYTKEQK